ncbi:hypothetical protein [Qipengyuania sp. RANM35]|uniref:hypothetical protein n=1 Tax=Qipengyuania sp. RANM35 TaxID=3068635 RepID=UPI0034DB34F3
MATAKTSSGKTRIWLWLALIALAIGGAAWVFYGEGVRRTVAAGTAYGAHVACSCRFIEGRSMSDCAKDKLEGMEFVRFSADEEAKSVTASVPLVASDTAFYREGYGCVLQPWEG